MNDKNTQKKLMLLGGTPYLLSAINSAHELGAYVITADYLPDNFAHKYADEYVNVSIIDKDAVLEVAKEKAIDGIMSFATDPGVTTEAYVAEKMGLPASGSYASVSILQNKGKFRAFLADNGFNVPKARTYSSVEKAMKDIDCFSYPVIVKPTDSAGSKGVSRVDDDGSLRCACEEAFKESHSSEIIIEEFIEQAGFSTDSDSFSINGKLVFCSFNDQCFDNEAVNPYTPAGFMWPSTRSENAQKELKNELQRLLTLLQMRTSLYNVEARIGKDGKPYIMEVSPRAGGNCLSECLKYACGQDIIKASVMDKLGMELKEEEFSDPVYNGCLGEIILHSEKAGVFSGLEICKEFAEKIVKKNLWVSEGEQVFEFTGANRSIGTIIYKCSSRDELEDIQTNWRDYVSIILK